jgi:hypothetical protein
MFNTNSIREKEDLSSVVDLLLATEKDMRFCSMVNFLKRPPRPITAQKHEWLDLAARAVTLSLTASGAGADWDTNNDITGLPVADAERSKLRVGDILELPTGPEQVIVKSIDNSADTIDLIARGHGSTNGTAQGAVAFTAKIIGNAQIEDADPIDGNFQGLTAVYNYTQVFEDVADQSGTLRRSAISGGDTLDMAVALKLKELIRSLNRQCIWGLQSLDTTNKISTMGGVREFLSGTKNIGAALTIALLEATVVQAIDAGCNPSAIHASPAVISKISQLFVGNVAYKESETKAGMSVATLNMSGLDIALLPDRDVLSSEMLLLDHDRVFLGPLEGGQKDRGDWATYMLTENLKQTEKQVGGEFTMEVRNAAGAGIRAYGIT